MGDSREEVRGASTTGQFKVAVIGDFMTDVYWIGKAERLSPEAPIPVVKIIEQKRFAGGAGNVAIGLSKLGCWVSWFGEGGPTKHRLVVDDIQLARWDQYDECKPVQGLDRLRDHTYDAIVVSDYGKGSIDHSIIQYISQFTDIPIFVDTKRDPSVWGGVATAVFPNEKERLQFKQQYDDIECMTVTKLGAKGLTLRKSGRTSLVDFIYSPSQARFVKSVNGAGDSVMAGFVYRYLSLHNPSTKSQWQDILDFANTCAALAVEQPYTYAPTIGEVEERLYANS